MVLCGTRRAAAAGTLRRGGRGMQSCGAERRRREAEEEQERARAAAPAARAAASTRGPASLLAREGGRASRKATGGWGKLAWSPRARGCRLEQWLLLVLLVLVLLVVVVLLPVLPWRSTVWWIAPVTRSRSPDGAGQREMVPASPPSAEGN